MGWDCAVTTLLRGSVKFCAYLGALTGLGEGRRLQLYLFNKKLSPPRRKLRRGLETESFHSNLSHSDRPALMMASAEAYSALLNAINVHPVI